MTTYERADAAIKSYEAVIFAAVGHNSEAVETHILVLEIDALDACEHAARDGSLNQVTRDYYAREAAWFRKQQGI
jgi:hypothetical protein